MKLVALSRLLIIVPIFQRFGARSPATVAGCGSARQAVATSFHRSSDHDIIEAESLKEKVYLKEMHELGPSHQWLAKMPESAGSSTAKLCMELIIGQSMLDRHVSRPVP